MSARLNARPASPALVGDPLGGRSARRCADRRHRRSLRLPRTQLLEDLQEIVFFVGVHPFTPDSLIEVDVSDDQVSIRYADWFSRPLRLSPEDGARLLTAGRSVLAMGDTDDDSDSADEGETEAPSPLLRALASSVRPSERALSRRSTCASALPPPTRSAFRDALERGVQVELAYYSYGRDELSERRVEPAKVFSDQGNWYLSGWCHRAEGAGLPTRPHPHRRRDRHSGRTQRCRGRRCLHAVER